MGMVTIALNQGLTYSDQFGPIRTNYAESEYEVKILIPPTHVGGNLTLKFCVGKYQKF